MKRLTIYLLGLLLIFGLQSCGSSDDKPETPEVENPDNNDEEGNGEQDTTDWQKVANLSSHSLIDFYWNKEKHFFNYYPAKADTPAQDWNYWTQAHAMDVLIDAYLRTSDSKWSTYFDLWYEGVKQKSGNSYFNDFVDDMEWICLTMTRLYECTNESKYLDTAQSLWDVIKSQWNSQAGGGIAWKQSQPWSKNACSNGPAGIIATRMYRLNGQKQEDLNWAQKIYNWESEKLLNLQTGAIYDNIDARTGTVQTNWIFTYNQGTYIGMSHELYKITGEDYYLEYACKAANYCIQNLIDSNDKI
jgi:predicted alpha-1,6-mannanase (GH76 family)